MTVQVKDIDPTVNIGQHTVTRFYLDGFSATPNKEVFIRELGGETYGPKSTKSRSVEDLAFTIFTDGVRDDSLDGVNSAIETRIARPIKSLTPSREPTPHEWVALLFLSANLLARSRRTRDALKETIQWASYIAEDAAPILPPDLANAGAEINRVAEVLYPLTAGEVTEPLVLALKAKGCTVLTAPAGSVFVTSDDPVVVYVGGQIGKLELRLGFMEQTNVEVFLALKPCMAVLWHAAGKNQMREATADEVAQRNRDVYAACYKEAYSNCKEALDASSPV